MILRWSLFRPEKKPDSAPVTTSAQLGCIMKVLRGCVPTCLAEVDYFNTVTEIPCLLGLTATKYSVIQFSK